MKLLRTQEHRKFIYTSLIIEICTTYRKQNSLNIVINKNVFIYEYQVSHLCLFALLHFKITDNLYNEKVTKT